jgi:hypothetical protein
VESHDNLPLYAQLLVEKLLMCVVTSAQTAAANVMETTPVPKFANASCFVAIFVDGHATLMAASPAINNVL